MLSLLIFFFISFLQNIVSLEGVVRASHGLTHKFIGFFLTVEKDPSKDARKYKLAVENYNAGKFHIVEKINSKLSEKCPNLVTHNNSHLKGDVSVKFIKLSAPIEL